MESPAPLLGSLDGEAAITFKCQLAIVKGFFATVADIVGNAIPALTRLRDNLRELQVYPRTVGSGTLCSLSHRHGRSASIDSAEPFAMRDPFQLIGQEPGMKIQLSRRAAIGSR